MITKIYSEKVTQKAKNIFGEGLVISAYICIDLPNDHVGEIFDEVEGFHSSENVIMYHEYNDIAVKFVNNKIVVFSAGEYAFIVGEKAQWYIQFEVIMKE